MLKSFKQADIQFLTSAKDYREFIKYVVEVKSTPSQKYSYSLLARSSGFSSRAFLLDVVKGKKRLTLDSSNKVAQGMKLPRDLKSFFKKLVELEHPDCRQSVKSEAQLKRALENLKSRLNLEKEEELKTSQKSPYQLGLIPYVFAALGTTEDGADLDEIQRRLNLPLDKTQEALRHMHSIGLIKQKKNKFYPLASHLSLQGLGQDEFFKEFFLFSLKRASFKAQKNFNSKEDLFFSSVFSVPKESLENLKDDLRALALRYVDQSESANGDHLSNLIISLC